MTEHTAIKRAHYCDFCGLNDTEVEVIIRGPTSSICDNCIAVAADMVLKHSELVIEQKLDEVRGDDGI